MPGDVYSEQLLRLCASLQNNLDKMRGELISETGKGILQIMLSFVLYLNWIPTRVPFEKIHEKEKSFQNTRFNRRSLLH